MYRNVFLDANIIADIYDKNRPFYTQSKKTLKILLEDKEVNLFTSCDIITTLYYILLKNGKEEALNSIIKINQLCTIVDFGNDEVNLSCELMKKDKAFKDLEDTIQYILAKKINADLILSNDKGFISKDIEHLTSNQFINKIV